MNPSDAIEIEEPGTGARRAGVLVRSRPFSAVEDAAAVLSGTLPERSVAFERAEPGAGAHNALVPPQARPIGRRLGELAMACGLLSREQLDAALAEQRGTREPLGQILVRAGLITEQQLALFVSQQFKVPFITLDGLVVDRAVLALVPVEIALKHEAVPLGRSRDSLLIAIADPNNVAAIEDLGFLTGLRVLPSIATRSAVRAALERHYSLTEPEPGTTDGADLDGIDIEILDGAETEGPVDLLELRTSADEAPVVRLVNGLIRDAIRRRASDIHLEPFDKTLRVRFRVDGLLQHVATRARRFEAPIVSRIKIMANLDIAERRRPQDGHVKLRYEGREVDLRISILPTRFGESVTIRILDRHQLDLRLEALGLDPMTLGHFHDALAAPHGLILITGPTGSGKTTTLYAAVKALNGMERKILTVEDPVEYGLDGVNQVEVNDAVGRGFAAALRAFLRHDPDVILVGEMRDTETAQIAIRAGLTGHLVLSTLHTNDAPSTMVRLTDMGAPGFLVASAVKLVVAQRLVRRLCEACREPYVIQAAELAALGYTGLCAMDRTVYRAKGCAACHFTGVAGRLGLYQAMPMTEELRALTLANASHRELATVARQQGMRSLREIGFDRVFAGLTTIDEVLRITVD